MMPCNSALVSVLVAGCVTLGACAQTNYVPDDQQSGSGSPAARRVSYHVGEEFYIDPPDCAVVLPSEDREHSSLGESTGRAIARYLTGKIPRVIGPLERRRAERRMAFALDHPGDRRRFANETRCRAFVRWKMFDVGNDYLIVWSRQHFGLEVEMFREADGAVLWKASHVASRSDGGLPLSPLSAPVAAFEATQFSQDADVMPSLVDDAVRRIFVTLPDVR